MSPTPRKADKNKVKLYLQAHGHKKVDIDKQKWDSDKDLKKSVLELHGVTDQEYIMSGGRIDG